MKKINLISVLILFLLTGQAQTRYCSKYAGELIIKKQYITISYNKEGKIPNYVGYYLTPTFLNGDAERESQFWADTDIPAKYRAYSSDYTRSGYDRGHMSPAADWHFSYSAMHESFSMANICPQRPQLNRRYWKSVEDKERKLAEKCDTLFVISGEICTSDNKVSEGFPSTSSGQAPVSEGFKTIKNDVAVPSQFWKTIVGVSKGKVKYTDAWLFDNIDDPQPESEHRTTIPKIESLIGKDLYQGFWFNGDGR